MTRIQPYKLIGPALFILLLAGCLTSNIEKDPRKVTNMSQLHALACESGVSNLNPWGISNLYDCQSRRLFIPYQLWTGAQWDGNKLAKCMHQADSFFVVDGDSETTITGPENWSNPLTNKEEKIWVREKVNGSKTQYFTCHQKGIGRVYDSRRPRYYQPGRCKFPAGFDWKIAKRSYCDDTSIAITELSFYEDYQLKHIIFKWWFGNTLDHVYRYEPNYGMTDAWKQH